MTSLTAQVLPGRGTVCRRGHIGLWLGADVPDALAIQILDAAGSTGDDGFVEAVGSLVSAEAPGTVGTLAAVTVGDSNVDAILHGPAVVQNGRGEAHSGAFTSQVLRFRLPMDGLVGIWGSAGRPDDDAAVPQDLRDGTVPGGGLVIRQHTDSDPPPEPAAADPEESVAPPPSGTEDTDESEIQLVDLVPPPPTRPPLPIADEQPGQAPLEEAPPGGPSVAGVMCVNGHFNHPDAFYCRVCGIAMIQLTKVLVDGPRPALGVIVVGDGSTFIMDDDYLIGREPDPDGSRAITLADERVSRRHARLSAAGWDVVVTDLGSSNGTYVKNPGWQDWMKVAPSHPTVVEPRGQIAIGSQVLVYESSVRPSKV